MDFINKNKKSRIKLLLKNKLLVISLAYFFMSCSNNSTSKTTDNFYSKECKKDTSIESYDWGHEMIISIGNIKFEGIDYRLEAIERKISLVDSYKKRRLIRFLSEEAIYLYELEIEQNFPYCVNNNKIIFIQKQCSEDIVELGNEVLCLDCIDGGCLLLEE